MILKLDRYTKLYKAANQLSKQLDLLDNIEKQRPESMAEQMEQLETAKQSIKAARAVLKLVLGEAKSML